MSCERNFCPELCDEPDSSSMKYEDFISEDAASLKAWARPLPRRHLMAVGATICVAGTLFFALPDAQDLTLASKEAPDNRTLLQDTGSLSLDESGTLIDTPSSPVPAEESATLLAGTLRNAPAEDSALSSALSASREAAPDADAKVPAPARDVTILEEIIDPRVELTDAIASLTGPQGSESGAISPDNAEALITADAKAENLDNFEDTVPEDLLADSDSAMNDKLKALDTALNGKEEVQAKWYVEDIHRGDTISSLFSDFNIPWDVMQAITSHKEASASLTNLRPGNHLSFLIDDNNQLLAFVKQITATEQIRFYRDSPATLDFRVARESLNAHMLSPEEAQALAQNPPAVEEPAYKKRGRLVVVTVGKGQAFSTAAHDAGLTYSEINQITKLFKGRIQFSRHIQPGDTMRVLFSEDKGEGKINAVEFKLARQGTLATFRNVGDNRYYDENGYNVSTATFLRFPVEGKVRISSSFNPHRRHPVTGRVRPHNGTDFAVRVGTPVIAPAHGVVDKATYSRSAGYYIVIRHAGGYSTVYMHLSKLGVKAGQRVKQGQVIARSGNTGISTGPHLHYELRINNRPVNAMRVNLPRNEDAAIAQKQRQRFKNNVALYKRELYEDSLIAQNN